MWSRKCLIDCWDAFIVSVLLAICTMLKVFRFIGWNPVSEGCLSLWLLSNKLVSNVKWLSEPVVTVVGEVTKQPGLKFLRKQLALTKG